ncbi:MAG: alanine--tRNA ligase [Candidatus Micrarchaeia archaeon]
MKLDKDSLRKDFSKDYKSYYSTELFEREGFIRKKCKVCGKNFWTLDPERELCGDSEHEPYSFFTEKTVDIDYSNFWRKFAKFFIDNGHKEIEKYPVVSRWRQDLYFTIASIQDFQRIENGRISFEYSDNPLIVPQMCMRFNDIQNVGVTGRHLTAFMMAGQHAFNYPKEGYWRDRTIELNFKFLTEVLGVKRKNLTYTEDVWAMGDFSEFGPCIEAFSNGLELVNNVFTQFESSNGKVSELKGKVIDVGWGFERLIWFKSGKQTLYDSVFKEQLEYIHKNMGIKPDHAKYRSVASIAGYIDIDASKAGENYEQEIMRRSGISMEDYYSTIKPMQSAYAVADHMRTLLFGITDGALPSNVGGGYNLRVILRRVFDIVDEYGIDIDLMKLVESHARELKPIYHDIDSAIDEIGTVIEVERKRYNNTKSAANTIIDSIIRRKEQLSAERLKILYESNGIAPEYIAKELGKKGIDVEVPENFYSSIVKSDFVEARKEKHSKISIDVSGISKTDKLFYDFASESKSKVLKVEGNMVILDRTPFYAESGGQEADHGTINGIKVEDVQIVEGVIVHILQSKPDFKVGQEVGCIVDQDRRARLMAHHTATHLISAAARQVLGKHAWQEGAKKSAEKAHIDIAHYEKLTEAQVKKIEATANMYILNGIRVTMEEMIRSEAESEFGFSIYQGHGVPAAKMRIVQIRDLSGKLIDAEACGGLHLMNREGMIGIIRIIGSYRIHDGIDRIEFVAGPAALDYINSMERTLKSIAASANIDLDKLESGVSQKLAELKDYAKEYSKLSDELSGYVAKELAESAKGSGFARRLDYDRKMLRSIATKAVLIDPKATIILYNSSGDAVCASGEKSGRSAVQFISENSEKLTRNSFKGGGSERIAEGKLTKY